MDPESVTEKALGGARLRRTDKEGDRWTSEGPPWHSAKGVCLLGTDPSKHWSHSQLELLLYWPKPWLLLPLMSLTFKSLAWTSEQKRGKEMHAMEREKIVLVVLPSIILPLEISMSTNSQGDCLQSLLQIQTQTRLEVIRTVGKTKFCLGKWERGSAPTLPSGGSDESVLQHRTGRRRERTNDQNQKERNVERQTAGRKGAFPFSLRIFRAIGCIL